MPSVKQAIKKLLKVDANTNLTPIKDLIHLGSHYNGYDIPSKLLDSSSICYCIGAGDDITFDTEIAVMYGSKVFIFDPMPEAKTHYLELVVKTKKNEPLSVWENFPFTYRIKPEQLSNLTFMELGVWDSEKIIKFYEPTRENYNSHSILNLQKSDTYIESPVDRLSNIMKKLNHSYVDLVKIEIEGAEYTVIETIIKDKLDIKMILVEFDEVYHKNGPAHLMRIKKSTNLILNAGYKMVHTTPNYKRTFLRNDVYEKLK